MVRRVTPRSAHIRLPSCDIIPEIICSFVASSCFLIEGRSAWRGPRYVSVTVLDCICDHLIMHCVVFDVVEQLIYKTSSDNEKLQAVEMTFLRSKRKKS
jgi:hypothetical protein